MPLTGQGNERRATRLDDGGYLMVALLIGMAVAAVWMSVMLPAWRQQAMREREADLVFRGEQYARAIALYFRKNQQLPRDIDILVSQNYLRRKYKDPITGGDFLPIGSGLAQPQGATPPGRGVTAPSRGAGLPTMPGPSTPRGQTPLAPQGQFQGGQVGIFGVRSTSQETSIRVYQGQTVYALFPFDYQLALQKMGTAMGPGARPGGAGRQGGRGDEFTPLGGRRGAPGPGGVRRGGPTDGRGVPPGGGRINQPIPAPGRGRG
jgi:hypothetical protein